jgi:hypothetical protein
MTLLEAKISTINVEDDTRVVVRLYATDMAADSKAVRVRRLLGEREVRVPDRLGRTQVAAVINALMGTVAREVGVGADRRERIDVA